MLADFTLQINISPGDLAYADIIVRQLVKHHASVPNKLLVVDCCKPQKTKLVNPEIKFPEPAFTEKVNALSLLVESFQRDHLFTEVKFLFPEDAIFELLSKKYTNRVIQTTHGAGGTAQMAYWAGIELATTRYVIHFDGDILMYQKSGYEWWKEAAILMNQENKAIFAIPRNAPCANIDSTIPTKYEGTEIVLHESFWLHNWFSTRVFMIDKHKLERSMPLISGKLYLQLLLRKLPFRAFPLDPEIIFFRSLGLKKGYRRLILLNKDAWTLHPTEKTDQFISLLPRMVDSINNNRVPQKQLFNEDLLLDEWNFFLSE